MSFKRGYEGGYSGRFSDIERQLVPMSGSCSTEGSVSISHQTCTRQDKLSIIQKDFEQANMQKIFQF